MLKRACCFLGKVYLEVELRKLCPHLTPEQAEIVVEKFAEWQQSGYKQTEKLAAMIYLCLPPVMEDKKQEERFLDGMMRLFRSQVAHLFSSSGKKIEGDFKKYGIFGVGKMGKEQLVALEENLREAKTPVCPISFVELQDAESKKLMDGIKVSVLFRMVGGRCFAQLFETDAIRRWLSISRRDPVSNLQTSSSSLFNIS